MKIKLSFRVPITPSVKPFDDDAVGADLCVLPEYRDECFRADT